MGTWLEPENWETPQKILVILANPDDPEFFYGASIARWTSAGQNVAYCLLTCGDKGTNDRSISAEEFCAIRNTEQFSAAEILGVTMKKNFGASFSNGSEEQMMSHSPSI